MITRPYLLSTTSSSSSMGGLIIPSSDGVPATVCLPDRISVLSLGRRSRPGRLGRHQGYQLAADVPDGRVNERDIELGPGPQLDLGGFQPPPDHRLRLGLAGGQPAHQLVPGRRRQEDQERSRHRRADLAGAGHIDLQQRGHASPDLLGHRLARRAIAIPGEPRPLKQLPGRGHRLELGLADEEILAAVQLTRPRPAGRDRSGEPDLRAVAPDRLNDCALADAGGPGEHSQARGDRESVYRIRTCSRISHGPVAPVPARSAWLDGQLSPPNSFSSAVRWLAPSPRTRRDSAMPSRSMICLARTLPTPGMDSSNAETFILPTMSSVWPSLRTAGRVVEPCLSRFLTSARSLRALAAFSRAADRCSGGSGGRATRGHLGFRIEKVAPRGETSEFRPSRQCKPPFVLPQFIRYYTPHMSRY